MVQPIRRDPSGSKSVERLYSKNLTALVESYRVQCGYYLARHPGRLLESPVYKYPLSADDLFKSVQQLADITITQKSEIIAMAAARLAYLHGQKWADRALALRGLRNPATGITKPFYLPPEQAAIDKIKARNLMEIKGMSDELAKRMSRTLVEGFEKGETVNLLTRRIKEVSDFGKNRSVLIARTETMRAVNSAAKDRYERNGVEKVEWLAAWDDRTCPECESLNGKIFNLGEAPDLPVHPACRCTLAPIIGGED